MDDFSMIKNIIISPNADRKEITESFNVLCDAVNKLSKLLDAQRILYFQGIIEAVLDCIEQGNYELAEWNLNELISDLKTCSNVYCIWGKGKIYELTRQYCINNKLLFIENDSVDSAEFEGVNLICDDEVDVHFCGECIQVKAFYELAYMSHYMYWGSKFRYEEMKGNITGIATGISYFRDGIISEVIDANFSNLANGSQDVFYDLCMLKRAYEENKESLRKVIMGLAPYSLRYDETKSREQISQGRPFPYVVDFGLTHHLDGIKEVEFIKEQKIKIEKSIGLSLFEYLIKKSGLIEQVLPEFDMEKVFYSGHISANHIFEINGKYNKPYPDTIIENKVLIKQYIQFCEKNNLELLIVIPPFSNWHNQKWDRKYKDELVDYLYEIGNDLDFQLLDLSESLWPDFYFRDYSHLNKLGSYRLSNIIRQILM